MVLKLEIFGLRFFFKCHFTKRKSHVFWIKKNVKMYSQTMMML